MTIVQLASSSCSGYDSDMRARAQVLELFLYYARGSPMVPWHRIATMAPARVPALAQSESKTRSVVRLRSIDGILL